MTAAAAVPRHSEVTDPLTGRRRQISRWLLRLKARDLIKAIILMPII